MTDTKKEKIMKNTLLALFSHNTMTHHSYMREKVIAVFDLGKKAFRILDAHNKDVFDKLMGDDKDE